MENFTPVPNEWIDQLADGRLTAPMFTEFGMLRTSLTLVLPSLSVVAVTTLQFMPSILRWSEFREQFNEGLDAGNCAG
jgi:hypothetical protein